jgi:general secretion pathway protein D
MIQRKRISLLVLAGLLLLAAPTPGHAGPITLTAGSATVNVGDIFTIPVSVSNAVNLTSFQFDLSYNSAILSALSFTDVGTDFETAAINGGGSLTGITGFSSPGLLSGVADSMSGASSGLAGNGVLVDVEFQALAPGVSPLTLSDAFLTDDGNPLSSDNQDFALVNGQVTVLARQVPEPSALTLLAAGLAALGARARRRAAALGAGAGRAV